MLIWDKRSGFFKILLKMLDCIEEIEEGSKYSRITAINMTASGPASQEYFCVTRKPDIQEL